jgi:hypothetical protein
MYVSLTIYPENIELFRKLGYEIKVIENLGDDRNFIDINWSDK